MKCNYPIIGLLIVSILTLSGCNTNIHHIDNNVYCPVDYSFQAPFDNVWDATVVSVMKFSTMENMDKENGYLSSEIATVDGREMSGPDHVLFGQTYKFTYDIRLISEGKRSTLISTKVKLYYEQFMGISQRESHMENVENYLREKLYRDICNRLFPTGHGHCSRGVSANRSQVSSPAPEKRPAPSKRYDKKVQTAQKTLKDSGYNPGAADGIMGGKTKTAIEAYQRNNGLAITGKLDNETYNLLTQYSYQEPSPAPEPKYTPPEPEAKPEPAPVTHSTPAPPEKSVQATSPASAPPAKIPSGKYVTTDSTDLLQKQDLYGSEIIGNIPKGTTLRVLSKDGEYYKVRFKGKEGYIYGEFVEER